MPPPADPAGPAAGRGGWLVTVAGPVQGVGVRPRLARLSAANGWSGTVRNTARGVELNLAADGLAADAVAGIVRGELGAGAAVEVAPAARPAGTGFRILESDAGGPVGVPVPRDAAVCPDCLREILDPADRRYGYPFAACTRCGPRFSAVRAMPYDRSRTTFDAFPLCPDCRREYGDPADRRFHAQACACPACGPSVRCHDRAGRAVAAAGEAVAAAAAALRDGRVVALRGVGGYQLLADATSSAAVARLRARKRRPDKPFAVLCRDADEAGRVAFVEAAERRQLVSPENPIVLLRRRPCGPLAAAVCPGLDTVGVLLPTTPLHRLLAEAAARPLVCTSGNRDGDPLETEPAGAESRLAGVADLFLHHDRDIAFPVDDGVVRVVAGRAVTLRCGRGLAPLSLPLRSGRAVVALGAHQKAAFALANGAQAVLGPHVGDLDSASGRSAWVGRLGALLRLYGVDSPDWIWDAHPDYFPTRWADESGLRGRAVWHHHAHVAAAAAEHGLLDRPVLGVAFDGTGLGPDGTLWGGEFLLVRGAEFRRLGRLRPFALPGGEAAVRDVRRTAVAVLAQLGDLPAATAAGLLGLDLRTAERWRALAGSPRSPTTSSCGRLFDAVAALALGIGETTFEGQAAMRLEAAADDSSGAGYPFRIGDEGSSGNGPAGDGLWEVDWRPAVRAVVADLGRGADPAAVAARFHRGLAAAIVEAASRRSDLPVVLAGGVFQNRRLVEAVVGLQSAGGSEVVWPCALPPNDGGLAAGQLAVALAAGEQ